MSAWNIRQARPDDTAQIAALGLVLNAAADDDEGRFTPQIVARDLFGARPRALAFVAEAGKKLIGYAIVTPGYDSVWSAAGFHMEDLFVLPDFRRRGVARALMAALAAEAKRQDREWLMWLTGEDDTEAQAFYGAIGAMNEPVRWHALAFDAFARLAEEGKEAGADSIVVAEGWRPGALGALVGMHARYYAREWGLNAAFEAEVARDLGTFMLRYDRARDRLLLALDGDTIVGGVGIDGGAKEGVQDAARLRWFILDDGYRGRGVGTKLIDAAMAFLTETRVARCYLTTFAGLDPARRLYERAGFKLVAENDATAWGVRVTQQRFEWVAPGFVSTAG